MNQKVYEKYEIIDAHAHIFPEKIAENATINIGKFYDLPMTDCGISEKLIESGSKIGVSKYLVCSTATKPQQVNSINAFIADECMKNESFYGFGTAHPDSLDVEADVNQIKELGLHGVKLHPDFQLFDADSPEAYKIYEQIEGFFPVLIHSGDDRYDYSRPKKIARVAADFPKLKIIAAHLGGYQRWDEALECLSGLENVRFDICSSMSFISTEKVLKMIQSYGVENCFFGTDFPMWSHEQELEKFLALGFSEDENRKILSENFRTFMNI